MAYIVAQELSKFLQTDVQIKNVNIGLLNRVVVSDLTVKDESEKEMLKVARASVKFEILPLFQKRISISNIQLFGFSANLYRLTPDKQANYQFIIDKFEKKTKTETPSNIDLRINSILIRRGKVAYDVLSEPYTPGVLNTNHLDFQNIIANISLKAFKKDSINAIVKRICVSENQSGLSLDRLKFRLTAGNETMNVNDFVIELPYTALRLDSVSISYDSLSLLPKQMDKAEFKIHTAPSYFTLSDIAAFVPELSDFKDPIDFSFMLEGRLNNLSCSSFILRTDNNIQFTSDFSIRNLTDPSNALVHGNISKLYINEQGFDFLFHNLNSKNNQMLPAYIKNLQYIFFRGEVSGFFTDLVMYGQLHSGAGIVYTDLKLGVNPEEEIFTYSGKLKTTDFSLHTLLPEQHLGFTSLKININGRHKPGQYPYIALNGNISSLDYKKYTYQNINLSGKYNHGGFEGKLSIDDTKGKIDINGSFNTRTKLPRFNLTASIDNFYLDNFISKQTFTDSFLGLKLKADFSGKNIEEINGAISIDSIFFKTPDKEFFMDHFLIQAQKGQNEENTLFINSPFLKGNLSGKFRFNSLPTSIIQITQQYLPSLVSHKFSKKKKSENSFTFGFDIYDTELFSSVFDMPLHIYTHSSIRGSFSDVTEQIRIEGYFPQMQYKDNYIESGMLLCENTKDAISCKMRFTNLKENTALSMALNATAANDQIHAILNWGNNNTITYSGRISAITQFLRSTETGALKTHVAMQPTEIILNDTIWNIHPSEIVVDSGRIDIHNFLFSNGKRYLKANGRISTNKKDTIQVELQDINLNYVFDIAKVSDDVHFAGEATGLATANGVLSNPELEARLFVKDFKLNDGLLGNASIYGAWINNRKAIYLDAFINDKEKNTSHVEGYIYPIKPNGGLDLHINANHLNMKFLEYYMGDIARNVQGDVTGYVHFNGKFKELNLNGAVKANASLWFDVLGTSFTVNDSIRLAPDGITFDHVSISDIEGNTGNMDGYLHYKHFKDLRYRFNINTRNMLIMNIAESPDFPFYGKIYGTGNALLHGNALDGLEVNAAMTTNKNTTFAYSIGSVASATSNQFIQFVDKTPKRIQDSIHILSHFDLLQKQQKEELAQSQADIRLNILVDATPDAQMKIIMDPVAGDNISGRGSGNLRIEFYNKGDVKLFGNYRITQGVYKFSLQEVIRKDFIIQEGSSITFHGAPLDANMDIQATYTVPSASISDLIPDASSFIQQPNVRVNCLMNLSGALVHPSIKLDIELPNERDEVQSLVRNYISTEEQMNMQILYLLGIGKFYTENNLSNSDRQSSDMMSSVISSTLSGQLNNVLSQIIDNNNWNIGTNLSTGEKGWTDVEVEGILSGQLLNNRLIINGNFGYRDNPMANTNFIGDFEAEWLLTRSGEYRLKAYNETNDRYYTKTNLTTQGIGFIYRKEFEKWDELLFWNKWRLERRKKKLKEQTNHSLENKQ